MSRESLWASLLFVKEMIIVTDPKSPDRRFFWESVDKRSRRAMVDFLTEHFRYDTGNSWNRARSYACNMKIDRLGLDCETVDRLYDLIQVPEFYDRLRHLTHQFDARHEFRWQAGWNGRSGGYLVLYQGEQRPSKYRSYCTHCGQANYKSIKETGPRCGVCGELARVDYETPPMQICTYPFRGTDDGEDFETWELWALRQRTELVQEFDQLADDIVTAGLYLTQDFTVQEETVYMPTTKLVMRGVTA